MLGRARGALRRALTSGGGGCAGAARAGRGGDPRRHGERVRVADVAAAAQPAPRRLRGRRRARLRDDVGGRWQPVRRRRGISAERGVQPPTPDCCRRGTASRCSPSGTCTSTAPSASTSPRSRSRERANAIRRPTSLQKQPLTLDEYFAARMISDPLCLFDYTMETDGAVAVITTSADRAKDLRQPPVVHPGVGPRRQRSLGAGDLPVLPGARRRVRVVGAPAGGEAAVRDGRASRPPTSTWRCSTTTSRRW